MTLLCSVCGNESVAHDRCGGFRPVSDVREEIVTAILDTWRVMRADATFLETARRFADVALQVTRSATATEITERIIAAYSSPQAEDHEAVRERVALAIWNTTMRDEMTADDWCKDLCTEDREFYRMQAEAAIAAVEDSS